jgi:CHAT domain-containing protein
LENQFVVFVVGGEGGRGRVYHLPLKPFQVERLTYQLNLNYAMVAGYAHPSVAPVDESLIRQAQGLLSKLYQALLLPLEGALQHAKKLVIVPHGPLHSVPFHALFDQHQYLIEKYQISYVPVASLLGHCKAITPAAQGCLIFGHSSEGRLPFAVEEAQKVAALWGEAAFCENQAQIAFLRTHVAQQRLIHLACHGEFHADNALFSGLVLADGSLTTLDVYALRLQASLITLSACQTGQNIIGGGDELLGLMRAFLAAGTRSLLLTLWPVADLSTIQWMERFYTWLMEQKTKGQAVQLTQMEFIRGAGDYAPFRHPFFWAPFFLVGDDGEM